MHFIPLISSKKALATLCNELTQCNWIALDTEFIREKTYFPRPCLIQVATPRSIACIDPLELNSLSPLIEIFNQTTITKVFHSAYQDLELLYQLTGTLPKPVFDTQVAARMLGYTDQIGYGNLVQQLLGVTLDKSHTRTDWSIRPLSDAQLRYAADDVRYLCQLYTQLSHALREKGHLDWVKEDCERLYQESNFKACIDDAWMRVRGADRLKSRQLAVLSALATWREQQAMAKNLPRRWLLSDPMLLTLVRNTPKDLEALAKIRGISAKLIRQHGEQLISNIDRGLKTPQEQWPHSRLQRPPGPEQEIQVDLLIILVRHYALKQNLNPSILTTRNQLVKLIMGESGVPVMQGWRADIIGERLQTVLKEQAWIGLQQGNLIVEKR
ncbi:MAG: ribonuclease D [Pseudomonadota bacterium]